MSSDLYIGPSVLAPGNRRRPDHLARLIVWPLVVAFGLLVLIFYVLFSPVQVVGGSMEPSLIEGDRVLRTKEYGSPQRGDVVIVDVGTPSSRDDIIKRVVGVPGDTVEIRDDIAVVNGVAEQDRDLLLIEGNGEYREPLRVPAGKVYVMGDNRPVSLDSRYIGLVSTKKIRGEARYVFLPLHRVRAVH